MSPLNRGLCISDASAALIPFEDSANPRAHSIRGVSASINFMKNWFLKSVLKVAC